MTLLETSLALTHLQQALGRTWGNRTFGSGSTSGLLRILRRTRDTLTSSSAHLMYYFCSRQLLDCPGSCHLPNLIRQVEDGNVRSAVYMPRGKGWHSEFPDSNPIFVHPFLSLPAHAWSRRSSASRPPRPPCFTLSLPPQPAFQRDNLATWRCLQKP